MSKKIIIALTLAVILIGTTLTFRFFSKEALNKKSATEMLVQNVIRESLNEDPDTDGLKNWEEALHKTDPDNPDSDYDGTSDGDEVNEGRNPSLAGPNDKEDITDKTSESILKKEPSATDLFSKEILTKYMEAKKNGGNVDTLTAEEIVNTLLSGSYTTSTPDFDPNLLKKTSDSSLTTLKNYGNSLALILREPMPEGKESEILILERMSQGIPLTEKDGEAFSYASERYGRMAKKLADMSVPNTVIETHAKLIDSINIIKEGVIGLSLIGEDPVGSYTRIQAYGDGLDMLEMVLLDLKQFFLNNNIVFSSIESGYKLTQ